MSRMRRDSAAAGPAGPLAACVHIRRGAALVELALVISLLLVLIFGMFDLGLAVLRSNTASHCARSAARIASVHGAMAHPLSDTWGPATYSARMDGTDATAAALAPSLAGLDPASTTITFEWIDGDSEPGSRVRATVTTTYQPFLISLFGADTWTLRASSTVQINH